MNQVIVRHVPDPSSQRLLLEKGDVDVALDLRPDQLQAVASNSALRLQQMPRGSVFYLGLNQQHPILSKPLVWQALRRLIDYEGIARDLFHGQLRVNQSFLAEGVPYAMQEQPYRLDVAKAKQLLAEAGYPMVSPSASTQCPATPIST